MPLARHSFAGANSDDEPGSAGAGSNTFVSALNVFLEPGSVYAATGNVVVPYALPTSGVTRSLGGFEDGATGTAVALYYNSAGFHRLVRYDPAGNSGAGLVTTVLEWAGLNLSADLSPQGAIVDGLLVYLGADGLMRCVNLARAEAGFYTPTLLAAEPYALHLVKTPPVAGPVASFTTGTADPRTAVRVVQTHAYQFALRYRYADGEVTPLSSYSEWLDVTENPATTLRTGIRLDLPTPPSGVTEVEVCVREPDSGGWAVAETLRPTAGTFPSFASFFGLTTGADLTTAESGKQYESEWPAKAAAVAHSRIIKGNVFNEGYPTPTVSLTASAPALPGVDSRTLHERTSYRVSLRFYDAQGKFCGAVNPVTVIVPANSPTSPVLRQLALELTAADQNAEIPEWADYYQFLVAPNDRTSDFRAGQAGDVRAFLGYIRTVNTDGSAKETANLPVRSVAHERLWVDIGAWPSVGLGYVWSPGSGDLLRFLAGGETFPITGQYGDYVEVQWSGGPVDDRPLIEIFSPNTTPGETYYERGPRLKVLRDATTGARSYEQTSIVLPGDCFLIALKFPQLDFATNHEPPEKKRYTASPVTVAVESPVPLYRLLAGPPTTTTTRLNRDGAFVRLTQDAGPSALLDNLNADARVGTTQTVTTGQAASAWLDMGYGGRAALAVPLALQQVNRPTLLRFSGDKNIGSQLNGLSQWEAFSQYEEIPQEQGAVVRLSAADQTQSNGSVLLVNQERGDFSIPLGRGQVQTGGDDVLLTVTRDVLGSGNSLRGGYGTTDARAVVSYGGKVFYPCRRREEVLRYDRNGAVPLGEVYKFSNRLKALFRQYRDAGLTGCYNPRRKEYCLTFQPTDDLPGATVVFCDRPNREAWADQVSAVPEAGLAVGNELVTWRGGDLGRHSVNAPVGTFHGAYTTPQLQFVVAAPPDVAKRWQSLEVVSQSLWLPAFLYTDTAQQSQTRAEWFSDVEGVFRLREGIRRDQNTPGYAGKPWQAMDGGTPLVSPRLTVTVIAPAGTPAPLNGVGVSWLPRPGQSNGV